MKTSQFIIDRTLFLTTWMIITGVSVFIGVMFVSAFKAIVGF